MNFYYVNSMSEHSSTYPDKIYVEIHVELSVCVNPQVELLSRSLVQHSPLSTPKLIHLVGTFPWGM